MAGTKKINRQRHFLFVLVWVLLQQSAAKLVIDGSSFTSHTGTSSTPTTSSTTIRPPLNNNFPIRIINLARDTERWRRVEAEFSEKKVPSEHVHRIEAVYGKTLSREDLLEKTSLRARLFCTSGTIGCYLSHRKFWDIVATGSGGSGGSDTNDNGAVDYQMVCEDDVILSDDNFYPRVQRLIEEIQQYDPDWDVLLLGGFGCVHPSRDSPIYRLTAWLAGGRRAPRRVSPHWHVPRRPFGAHAYLLSPRGARRLLSRVGRVTYHVDAVAWGLPELALYSCDPMLVFQDSTTPSTLGGTTRGWETRIPSDIVVDDYTKMSLEWVFNEPFLKLPWLNLVITNGRYVVLGILGSLVGVFQLILNKRLWVLPVHLIAFVYFVFGFMRYMTRPLS